MELIPVKITIVRGDPRLGEDMMRYPKGYNASTVQLGGGPRYGKTLQIGNGDPEEHALILVEQWYLDEFIKDATKAGEESRVEVITEADADKFFLDHVIEQEEKVNDRQRLEVLALKKQAGLTLTADEKKAFDPADPTPGVVAVSRGSWKDFKAFLDKSKV